MNDKTYSLAGASGWSVRGHDPKAQHQDLALRAGVLILLLLPACRPESVPTTASPAMAEAPWSEQVSAVRDGDSTRIVVLQETVSAIQFEQLADGCEGLAILEIETADVPDDALAVLEQCPRLQRLKLGAPIGDAGADLIARVTSLQFLNLPDARFTDDGLASIGRLPELKQLRFHSPHVTDDGMTHVAGIDSLRFLHLIDVPITDAGLVPLETKTELQSFYLDGGRCTDNGLRELLAALPELHFHLDQLHLPDDPHAHPH